MNNDVKWLRIMQLNTVQEAPGHTMACVLNSAGFTVGTPFFVPNGYVLDAPDDGGGWDSPWHKAEHNRANRLQRERDELRGRLTSARTEYQRMQQAACEQQARAEHAEAERDALRDRVAEMRHRYEREVERLRAENERLRAAGANVRDKLQHALHFESRPLGGGRAVATWDEVAGPVAKPNQPAPQTHLLQSGDVVVTSGGGIYRLGRFVRFCDHIERLERWEDAEHPGVESEEVVLTPSESTILERDGVPTDKGLERLAEKAGFQKCGAIEMDEAEDVSLGENVWWSRDATDRSRKALAAALREMGGA